MDSVAAGERFPRLLLHRAGRAHAPRIRALIESLSGLRIAQRTENGHNRTLHVKPRNELQVWGLRTQLPPIATTVAILLSTLLRHGLAQGCTPLVLPCRRSRRITLTTCQGGENAATAARYV